VTHLPWYPAFPSNRHQAGNDIELLQTDVMRFMAILGLSLMAIFALVQGIQPEVRTTPREAPVESPSLVAQRGGSSADQNAMRLRELRRLLARAERTALTAKTEAAAAERARAQALAALASTQEALKVHQLREADVRRTLSERTLSVARLRRELESERQKTDLATATPVAERPEPSARKRAAPIPPGEGFSLRFASDAALRALVTTGAVSFYGLADRVAWRLTVHQGGLRYQSAPLPRAYHEMQPVTVPTGFVRALNQSVPRGVSGTVVWGVTLSGKIAHSIHRLMQQHGSGALVIERNGRVRREGATA
jgi:hypothetical protein